MQRGTILSRLGKLCRTSLPLMVRALRKSPSCRSEEHTSELRSLIRISYAVFCLTKQRTSPFRYLKSTLVHPLQRSHTSHPSCDIRTNINAAYTHNKELCYSLII